LNRLLHWIRLAALGLASTPLWGCDYSASESLGPTGPAGGPLLAPAAAPGLPAKAVAAPRAEEERTAILESSITLIQRAALQPGGKNFQYAVQKLNQYFEGSPQVEYQLDPAPRQYLATQFPPNMLKDLENKNWTLRDARHLEDCMMYYGIATRVAETGENIDRVRRVFDWVVRQIQLVPPGARIAGRLPHVFARPYDVLMRGMATEENGFWAERAWLFMALCRQLDIDTGLITYSKSNTLDSRAPVDTGPLSSAKGPKSPIVWICAALIDDKMYLFDARLGLPVPGPDGTGVATLEDALADPAVLERMNLPGLSPYGTSRASLLGSPTKIGILFDSSRGYFSPKMRMLQRGLTGKHRTILYRDPAEQRDHFAHVLGSRAGVIGLWSLPLEVETRLFTDARYVEAIQSSLVLFQRDFPLVYARVKQLRGELDEAIEDYVRFRFAENAPTVNNKKLAIPKEVQDGLDVYATYYLALAHLERKNFDQAELMFKQTLELLPESAPNQPYYHMFRWGANANLGRIYEAKKDRAQAIAHYIEMDPTPQYVGNLVRARELVWADPIAPASAPLPRTNKLKADRSEK
jgi:hypothetical protein